MRSYTQQKEMAKQKNNKPSPGNLLKNIKHDQFSITLKRRRKRPVAVCGGSLETLHQITPH